MQCDIVLFVATQTEVETLEEVARQHTGFERCKSDLGEYFDLGKLGYNRVIAVKVRMGSLRYGGAAWQSINFRIATGATGLIAVGTAFGVDQVSQKIGDVLISTKMIPYDDRKIVAVPNGGWMADRSGMKSRSAKASLVKLMKRHAESSKLDFEVHEGSFLSGGAQIQSTFFRNELVSEFSPQPVGGDMETVALASTCDPNHPNWIAVKGISDFADDNRDKVIEDGRKIAAHNAIKFVLGALAQSPQ